MPIAWFHPPAEPAPARDDTAALLTALAASHHVTAFDARTAHDFVWRHARAPFDVCVYELDDTPGAAFIWPYLLHYPGVLRLRAGSLRRARTETLAAAHRRDDDAAERAFSGRDPLRIPLLAARLVVVGERAAAQAMQETHPHVPVRYAPLCAPPGEPPDTREADPGRDDRGTDHQESRGADLSGPPGRARQGSLEHQRRPISFGVADPGRAESIARAAARARDAGLDIALQHDAPETADVVLALRWPPDLEPPIAALSAMAAARPVAVFETTATAGWPAFDPQTWQPRGFGPSGHPIAVSIDPRDEEHSILLTMKRLAADPVLRDRLGRAGHAWWQAHATPAHAAAAWTAILEEAAALPPPARPPDWPAHLTADGSERARALLAEVGARVDFLR